MKAGRKEWTEAGSLAEMTQNNSLPTEERNNPTVFIFRNILEQTAQWQKKHHRFIDLKERL